MEKALSSYIKEGKVTLRILTLLQRRLLDILADLEKPVKVTAEKVIISDDMRDLRIEDDGKDNNVTLADMISSYGEMLKDAYSACPERSPKLLRIAQGCIDGKYNLIEKIQLDVEKRISNTIYIPIIILLVALIALLAWMNNFFN